MPLEKPSSNFLQIPRNIPYLAWSLPRRAPPLFHEHIKSNHLESGEENVNKTNNGEAIPSTTDMLSQPPPPPIKSDTLPTISVTRMGPRRMCDFPWYDKEVIDSASEYILCDEVNRSETMSEGRSGEWVAVEDEVEDGEKEKEVESGHRDLRGTFEISRLSVGKLQCGMEPEKPDSVESKLPQFPLKCSCESLKEKEPIFKSPHLSTDEEEGEVEEVESGRRDLRGTFEISRLSVEKVQYEMEPEKPDSIESTLPQFPLKCSCESVKEEKPTYNSPQIFTVDVEDAVCPTSPLSTRRRWFKRLRIRLRRIFLCYNAIEDD
nr:hypothetical transcript [Hymenolepis microstoma]